MATSPEHPPETFDDHAVSFVTYDANDEWWSVVAKGRLEDIERDDVGTDALEGLDRVEIPLIDIFGSHPREIDFTFCRLEPTAFTGRREAITAP